MGDPVDGLDVVGGADAARLRSLLDIAKAVGAVGRFDDLVEVTAEAARRALDAASLSVLRWDRERAELRTIVNVGLLGRGEVRFPRDDTYPISRWAQSVDAGELPHGVVFTVDAATPLESALLQQRGKDSSLAVPIVVEARIWGVLYATRTATQHRFSDGELDFSVAVATQVAAGVVQADHFARVERLAFQDPLTGLANRRAVDERLEQCLAEHAATGAPVGLVLADINRLKQVNDSFGHEAGDRLIVSVAEAVSRACALAPGSLAARIGGDEFCVVVNGVPPTSVIAVAEELCRIVDGQPMSTGVSCGVATTDTLPETLDSPVRLFRLADAAQYRAKRAGAKAPVVAGQSSADVPPDTPVDRRSRRGRLAVDVGAALESGLEVLDRLTESSVQGRIEAVAEHMLRLLDAAAWWVSYVPLPGRTLVGVSNSIERSGVAGDLPGDVWVQTAYELDEYPVTDAAVRESGAFHAEVGQPGNDPAEEAVLASAGYTSVMGAGAMGEDAGWLVEIYGDTITLPFHGLEGVLRALLSVAVTGAVAMTPERPTEIPELPGQAAAGTFS